MVTTTCCALMQSLKIYRVLPVRTCIGNKYFAKSSLWRQFYTWKLYYVCNCLTTRKLKKYFLTFFHNFSTAEIQVLHIFKFWKVRKEVIKVSTNTAATAIGHYMQVAPHTNKKRSVLSDRGGFQSAELPETICLYER